MPDAMPAGPVTALAGAYDLSELFIRDEGDGNHICLNQENGFLVIVNDTAARIIGMLQQAIPGDGGEADDPSFVRDARQLLASLERRRILRRRTP